MVAEIGAVIGQKVLVLLLEAALDYIIHNVKLIGGLDKNVRLLMDGITKLKDFVEKSTQTNNSDEFLETLLDNVFDIIYEAEDAIHGYMIQKMTQDRRGVGNRFLHLGKYYFQLSYAGDKCEKLVALMEQLYEKEIPMISDWEPAVLEKRVPTPALEETMMTGFKDVILDITDRLKQGDNDLECHSIVGMVGVGKSYIARKLVLDPVIELLFMARIFITVSHMFNEREIILDMLSHFMGSEDLDSKLRMADLDTLKGKVYHELKQVRFFVVLDDLWRASDWDNLKEIFPDNKNGSRVLITTRNRQVASYVNSSANPPYEVRSMSKEESKNMLHWRVFGKMGCPKELEPFIKELEDPILDKCKGLPLAIVIVAGVILSGKSRPYWWTIVHKRMLDYDIGNDISEELINLSYCYLPYHIKPCFLYLGIFPDNMDICVEMVTELWIAEGFISGEGNLNDIAECYLEEMVDRCLVTVVERRWDGRLLKCRVHSFLQEFCRKESKKRGLYQEIRSGSPIEVVSASRDVLRISINSEISEFLASKPKAKRVRSFLNITKENTFLSGDDFQLITKGFKRLRIFAGSSVKFANFPTDLFMLIFLKYVSLNCDVDSIGKELGKLLNLQTFILDTNCRTLNFRADVWNMPSLKKLVISSSTTLPPLRSTHETSKLETLMHVAPECCTLKGFLRCKKVKSLGIRGELARGGGFLDSVSVLNSLELLSLVNTNSAKPLPNLPNRFPVSLKTLVLDGTSLTWDHVSLLGEIPNLEIIKLMEKSVLGCVWKLEAVVFHKLAEIHLQNLNICDWVAADFNFPHLTYVSVQHCSMLNSIPHDFVELPTLRSISLFCSPKAVPSALLIKKFKLKAEADFRLTVVPVPASMSTSHEMKVGEILGDIRKNQPCADAVIVKEKVSAEGTPPKPSEEELNPFTNFPSPLENLKVHAEIHFSDGYVQKACNSFEVLEKHLKVIGGKVMTCFAPVPNGCLHIGHAKAMFLEFGLAKDRGGCCYLRYDDTNPHAGKEEYFRHIEEIVRWMGWEPFKITYTSDYFQELYELAVELIRRGHAYVDHQTPEEIKEYRDKKMNSPWRDRPIEESLKLFDEMKSGMHAEGAATLRMKQDMQSDNFNMHDLIAYRIEFTPHPHTGNKWCIYPSYDYAHCIVDSLENITHSLCTLEFETCRASYYWLLDVLGLYQPYVWEYSRLNVANTVMSKRKLNRLVMENYVDGWDDPRMMTLAGLRRRGVTPSAINAFVRGLGITRSDSSLIRLDRLEHHIREELNATAPRTMVVLKPLKVVITNLAAESVMELDAKKWPDAKTDDLSSFYKVPFSNVVYIEQTDFRLKDSKDYYGLAPGKSVLLRYAFPIKCTDVIYDEDKTSVIEIRAEYDSTKKTKPKGVLHWVAEPSPGVDPLKVEVRLFDRLFKSENPAELENWLVDLNPESKVVIQNAYAVPTLKNAAIGARFQFERNGYFSVDLDSTAEKLIFNRTVTLRDSFTKGAK